MSLILHHFRYIITYSPNFKKSRDPEHIPFGDSHACNSVPVYQSAHVIWSSELHRFHRYD